MCGFAAPAQLTVPSSLRWALVFADEANGVVAMRRSLPRAWFAQPNATLEVDYAPVSRQLLQGGGISFSLRRSGATHAIVASVAVAGRPGPALKMLSLRLRLPKAWGAITSVTAGNGETGRASSAVPMAMS